MGQVSYNYAADTLGQTPAGFNVIESPITVVDDTAGSLGSLAFEYDSTNGVSARLTDVPADCRSFRWEVEFDPAGDGRPGLMLFQSPTTHDTGLFLMFDNRIDGRFEAYARVNGSGSTPFWTGQTSPTTVDNKWLIDASYNWIDPTDLTLGLATTVIIYTFNGTTYTELERFTTTDANHQIGGLGIYSSGGVSPQRIGRMSIQYLSDTEPCDIGIIAGQSIPVGRAFPIDSVLDAFDPRVAVFDQSDRTLRAQFPLPHNGTIAGTTGESGTGPRSDEFGLGRAPANRWVEITRRTLKLLPMGRGNTGFLDGSGPWVEGGDLYVDLLNQVAAAKALNPANRIAFMIWHQGEAERTSQQNTDGHLQQLRNFFDTLRANLDEPELRILTAGISTDPAQADQLVRREQINAQIELVASEQPHTLFASAAGLTTYDTSHFNAADNRILDERLAALLSTGLDPIEVKPGWLDDGRICAGATTPEYTGGVAAGSALKPGLTNSDGSLRSGVAQDDGSIRG